ncbi:hypothetical protein NIES2100_53230 [Calothrix sp. NIES-2100]|uniref:hypothetical protein n=1 Tax=Calothrix sp. NIES-2100 TaxID=1954172 RepID=UPI000B5EE21A|nr:hypothetical protein NIES2100_53230 [Calothrix sp. NIES-2100]
MSILSDLQTKKLGLFELIAMGFDLYLKYFRSFFILLCMMLPFSIIYLILTLNLASNPILLIPYYLFLIFYFFVVIPVYTIALAILTEGYVLGENPQLNLAIQRILSRFIPLTGLNIRFNIIFLSGLLLLIVPGVIYAINNGYFALAFILRDQRGKAAFQYSRSLVKGNWLKVFLFNVLLYIIIFGLQALMNKILSSVIVNYPVLITILSSTLASLVTLGVTISGILLFLNLEFQKQ